MARQITSRDVCSAIAGAGYVCLGVAALTVDGDARGGVPIAVFALLSLAATIGTALYVAWSWWDDRSFDLRLLVGAPAVGLVAGLLVAIAGRPLGGLAMALLGAVVGAVLLYRDMDTWRWTRLPGSDDVAARRNLAQTAAVAVAATTPATPRQPRLSPADRADRFVGDVRAMSEAQLEALIEAWGRVDAQARTSSWDAARPFLTAADRKDLLTQVREELKHWAAGDRSADPSLEVPAAVRRRAGRALLDAAVGVIAQDRVSKHNFDVLYAPFQSALTGEPVKIARARASRSGAARGGSGQAAGQAGRPRAGGAAESTDTALPSDAAEATASPTEATEATASPASPAEPASPTEATPGEPPETQPTAAEASAEATALPA